jgi:hypothetical protein
LASSKLTDNGSADLIFRTYRERRMSTRAVTIGEVVRVGPELKRELEPIARQEFSADATWLARRVLQEYLRERATSEG